MVDFENLRGFRSLVLEDGYLLNEITKICNAVSQSYGYQPGFFPLLEKTKLFTHSIGTETDIVGKEMYSFFDKNNVSVTLRPEGTAGVAKTVLANNLVYGKLAKISYFGPMFRYEKPQKGRYRQFYQYGIELFGSDSVAFDIEILSIAHKILVTIGLDFSLEINSIGKLDERRKYQTSLLDFLNNNKDNLDADSRRRLDTNPMRVLDSKNENTKKILRDAPLICDFLSNKSEQKFIEIKKGLDKLGISYNINPYLVRGLDYYNDLVFEFKSMSLGAQDTICAGGRYDSLCEFIGNKNLVPAIGFAIGLDRLLELVKDFTNNKPDCNSVNSDIPTQSLIKSYKDNMLDLYVIFKVVDIIEVIHIVEQIRNRLKQDFVIQIDSGNTSFKSQMKKADKLHAKWVLVLGEAELASNSFTIKDMNCGNQYKNITLEQFLKKIS